MSFTEIERFIADLGSNAALRADALDSYSPKTSRSPLDCAMAFVALAESKGYCFTIDEMKSHVKATFAARGKTLIDEEFDVPGKDFWFTTGTGRWEYVFYGIEEMKSHVKATFAARGRTLTDRERDRLHRLLEDFFWYP
jgi:hypothetical protein